MSGVSNGKLVLDSAVTVTSSGDNNDVPVTGSLMYISVSNDMDAITGLDPGDITDGALILVVNIGPTNNLVLKNNSGSSAAQNVILSANGSDYVVPPFNTAILGYDTTNLMWHIVRVPDSVPSSTIQMWGSATAPKNWLLCDGTAVSRASYPGVFSVVGTTYGAGDGSTTFNLPDLRQRFPLGKAASGTGSSLGGTGGSIDHLHTVDPPSTTTSAPTGTSGQLVGIINVASATHTHTVDIASFNSGTNNPPFQVVNFIIKI